MCCIIGAILLIAGIIRLVLFLVADRSVDHFEFAHSSIPESVSLFFDVYQFFFMLSGGYM